LPKAEEPLKDSEPSRRQFNLGGRHAWWPGEL
jgi:hypothetical protein